MADRLAVTDALRSKIPARLLLIKKSPPRHTRIAASYLDVTSIDLSILRGPTIASPFDRAKESSDKKITFSVPPGLRDFLRSPPIDTSLSRHLAPSRASVLSSLEKRQDRERSQHEFDSS